MFQGLPTRQRTLSNLTNKVHTHCVAKQYTPFAFATLGWWCHGGHPFPQPPPLRLLDFGANYGSPRSSHREAPVPSMRRPRSGVDPVPPFWTDSSHRILLFVCFCSRGLPWGAEKCLRNTALAHVKACSTELLGAPNSVPGTPNFSPSRPFGLLDSLENSG